MKRRVPLTGLLLSFLTLASAVPAGAQSAEGVLKTAMERFEKRMAGIDNYTIVQEVMGVEVTSYYEKQIVGGRPVLVLKDTYGGGEQDMSEYYHGFMEVADRARLEGTEIVDGNRCHVVLIEDFSGIDFGRGTPDEEDDFTPKIGRFLLDTDDYVIRKIYFEGDLEHEGQSRPVTMELALQDYREVGGMLHPFRTEMMISGLAAGLSDEELEEARKSLEELKQRMAEMPESQRKMMESMMKGQLEQLEQMVNSGSMQITTEVKEVRVNAGPPEGTN